MEYPKTSWTKNSSSLAPCANSLQNFWDVEWIESFTHRWWYVSCFTTLAQMGIVSATLFLQSWLDIAQNPISILSSPFGKMRDLQYSLNLCVFHELWKHKKHEKWRFSHICKIVKNSKKFSYTWFISPRIIYCLVPRQPPIWGWGYTHGDPSRKVVLFVTWRFS